MARASDVAAIGIDAEPHEPLPDGSSTAIALPHERAHLRRPLPAGVHWDRLLFSAKESVYKAWFPLTRRWLGFEEAALLLAPGPRPERGTFTADLLVDAAPVVGGRPVRTLRGRYAVSGGLLGTAITLAAE